MRVQPINDKNLNFAIRTKPVKRREYAPDCWNDISEGAYKDYSFLIYENYEDGKKGPVMIILRKAGTWVKTKIKYMLGGERKVKWNYFKQPCE